MKKIILFSNLSFMACLVQSKVRALNDDDYEIVIGFVPEAALDAVVARAVKKYDLSICLGYTKVFTENAFAANSGKLLSLYHQLDEQGGKLIINLPEQEFEPEIISLINKIKEIADDQIERLLFLDVGDDVTNENMSSSLDDFFALKRRYFQALMVVENYYGVSEKIKLHENFLLELIGEEENEYWIDDMIQIHTLPQKKTPTIPFPLKIMQN